MAELRTTMTIDDYWSAWDYLLRKQELQVKAAEEAKMRSGAHQRAGRSMDGGR